MHAQGYRVYSSFFADGYWWGLVYECAFGKYLSMQVGAMSAGNGQMAAKDNTFHVMAAWLHCLHYTEFKDCTKAGLTVNADFFHPEYEITHS